jgi:hypothetical protein
VSPSVLQQDIPGQEVLVVIWSFCSEYLHRVIALERRIIDAGDEGAQGRVVV